MKIKHTVKVLAVILVLAMMPLYLFGCGNSNSKVGDNLVDVMVGDGSIKANDKNPASKAYIAALDADVKTLVAKFSGTGWSDALLEDSNNAQNQWAKNIYKLSTAWATKGSEYYRDGSVMDKIKAAFTSDAIEDIAYGRNLSMNERCDAAEYLIRSLLIVGNKIDDETKELILETINTKFPTAFGTGAEYVRTLYIAFGAAVLSGDKDNITSVITKNAPLAYVSVATGNGLYSDGSYLTDEVASSASYGVVAFNILTEIATAVSGTDFDFSEEQKSAIQDLLYTWAINSIIPSLYNGSAFAGMVGSYIAVADEMGGAAISGLLAFAEYVGGERADEIKSIVKGYSTSNNNAFAAGFTSNGACLYQDIAGNEDIEEKKVTGAFAFANMDKLSILGNKYSVSLSISSDRSVKYETRPIVNPNTVQTLGGVNGNGWYTGDGMLLLYTSDYQVDEKYWTYVNGKRIPGTTVDTRDRTPADDGTFDGITPYAGSAVLGSNAVSSYLFYNNNSQLISDLKAKKSYFFFDGKIVALGAGITNTYVDPDPTHGEQTIETVIENIITSNASVASAADDVKVPSAGTVIDAPEAMYVIRYGGIYVPADKNDGVYYRLNEADGGKAKFIEIWIDHGKTPENASYEYVIIPSSTKKTAAFFEYIANVDYEVLSNTTTVQAVKDTATGLVGYTFWEAGECNGIKTDFACNMMVKENDAGMTIALSDYTHNGVGNRDGGNITIPAGYSLKGNVAGVTLNGNVLTIDRAVAADGNTITIQLTK